MLLRIVVAVVVIVAVVLLFAATEPNTFRLQRSILIDAPPKKIFALINDFHQWPLWAPQDKEDASMRRTFSSAASGVGAISDWTSRGSAGSGRMTIIESSPGKIVVQADWVKPFAARNRNEFSLEAHEASTKITWSMEGTNVYMLKVMSIFTNMDKFMGKHFENGLANLKAAAEK